MSSAVGLTANENSRNTRVTRNPLTVLKPTAVYNEVVCRCYRRPRAIFTGYFSPPACQSTGDVQMLPEKYRGV